MVTESWQLGSGFSVQSQTALKYFVKSSWMHFFRVQRIKSSQLTTPSVTHSFDPSPIISSQSGCFLCSFCHLKSFVSIHFLDTGCLVLLSCLSNLTGFPFIYSRRVKYTDWRRTGLIKALLWPGIKIQNANELTLTFSQILCSAIEIKHLKKI